jgi:hypothetical protein
LIFSTVDSIVPSMSSVSSSSVPCCISGQSWLTTADAYALASCLSVLAAVAGSPAADQYS